MWLLHQFWLHLTTCNKLLKVKNDADDIVRRTVLSTHDDDDGDDDEEEEEDLKF